MRTKLVAAALGAACCLLAGLTAQAGTLSVTSGVDYSTGHYGNPSSTDITYVPITGTYDMGDTVVKVTVPWLQITGPKFDPNTGAVLKGAPAGTESGLGDVVVGVSRNVVKGNGSMPWMDVTGKVKLPTADASRGLGTGKADYSAQLDLYNSYGKLSPFATLGYKILGKPAGADMNNVFFGTLGASYKVAAKTSIGAMYDARQAPSPTSYNQSELTAFVTHQMTKVSKVQAYVVKGFSQGSPDHGVGVMGTLAF